MYWCSFVTLYISVACIYSTYSQDTLDTLEPIVKISPAKATGSLYDRFGFSVTAHRLEDINNGDTLEDILRKTTLVILLHLLFCVCVWSIVLLFVVGFAVLFMISRDVLSASLFFLL